MNVQKLLTKILVFSLLFLAALTASATLTTAINHILDLQANNIQVGVYVKDLSTGTVLYNQDGTRPMTPASNTKVFTAAAAYLYLGPNYHYVTELNSIATPENVMKGNVYMYFSGDPTLTSRDIYALVNQLKQQGVHQISGNVVIDDSVFTGPDYGLGWPQDDLAYCYAAPVGGAIINSNCMALHIVKARGYQTPKIKQYTTQFPVVNQLKLVGPAQLRTCVFQPSITSKNNIILQGCLPSRGQWNIAFAIKNPSDYAVQVVAAAFKRAGIRVNGKFVNGITPESAKTLAQHSSKSLQNILSYMLKRSDNVYAGAVGKTLGNAYYGVGSYKSGVNAINAILGTHMGSLFKPVYLEDTSGMSLYNLVSAQQLVQVLDYMYHQPNMTNLFIKSLAVCGQKGTLAYRLNKWPLLGHVYGKTGTLNGVSTLSGYVMVPGHPVIGFAIMMNGIEGSVGGARYVQDKIVRAIAANT
jgi:serine-type D-Ala-D-Ala carboxypeptidase/endopeptidase (penicillin-binding protein 4)